MQRSKRSSLCQERLEIEKIDMKIRTPPRKHSPLQLPPNHEILCKENYLSLKPPFHSNTSRTSYTSKYSTSYQARKNSQSKVDTSEITQALQQINRDTEYICASIYQQQLELIKLFNFT